VTAAFERRIRLRPGASQTLRFPISLLSDAPPGTYHLIAAVYAPDGSTTAIAGPMITIAKPTISIIASNVAASRAAASPGGKLGVSLALQNAGNLPVSGSAGLAISISASPSGADAMPAATVPLRVKLKVGQSRRYGVRIVVPKTTAAGSYYVVASLAVSALGDANPADGIAVSGMPITVR
jgi:uncharacterized membrane protein